jgi:catechol 2,3-dioxygenase-like lactoylglutathione lyase family enzyme
MTEEIYPMPSFPTRVVRDLQESSKFYQEALGFKHIFAMPGPGGKPALVHLRWLKYADLLLASPGDSQNYLAQHFIDGGF